MWRWRVDSYVWRHRILCRSCESTHMFSWRHLLLMCDLTYHWHSPIIAQSASFSGWVPRPRVTSRPPQIPVQIYGAWSVLKVMFITLFYSYPGGKNLSNMSWYAIKLNNSSCFSKCITKTTLYYSTEYGLLILSPLSPHDALKHHFTFLKTVSIVLQLRVLERKFPWNWFTNSLQFL